MPQFDPDVLPTVRRFEAAGFRAWPASSVHYDGTWVIRLTAGHPAKRLNSINPLDPGDCDNLAQRIEGASRRFEEYGRPTIFRMSPLGGEFITAYLDQQGWTRFDESWVMAVDLTSLDLEHVMNHIPMKDMARFIAAAMVVHDFEPSIRPGLSEVVGAIEPQSGLFLLEDDEKPVASAICVHDGELAGLFEVATAAGERGRGHGRRVVLSALKWARLTGARVGWLQVEAGNRPAIALYESLGFRKIYGYHYRQPSQPSER